MLGATADGAVTLYYDDAAKLATASGGVTVTGTLTPSGVVTANAGVVVDNFTLDGTTLALSSGDMTLDAAGDINLDADGGEVFFKDGGTSTGKIRMDDGDLQIRSLISDKDITLEGNDNGSIFEAMRLDMSAAGAATFNASVLLSGVGGLTTTGGNNLTVSGSVADHAGLIFATHAILPAEEGAAASANVIDIGANGNEFKNLYLDTGIIASNALSIATGTDLTLDAAGDIILDADGGDIKFKDGGVGFGGIFKSGNDLYLQSDISDGDIKFYGSDGGSAITALTLDMSAAGAATFNAGATFGGKILLSDNGNTTIAGLQLGNAGIGISVPTTDQMNFITADVSRFVIAADGSLSTPTAGTSNVRFGVNAGNLIASGGNYNVFVGDEAGTATSTGDNNTAVGYAALATEDGNGSNTAIGWSTLKNLNAGAEGYNTAVGYDAGRNVTTGLKNTLIGSFAGNFTSTADSSTFIGYNAGLGISGTQLTGDDNTAVGRNTGALLQGAANSNTLVGAYAGDSLTTSEKNTAVGFEALSTQATYSQNTAIGYRALKVTNGGYYNTAVGHDALSANLDGLNNTAVGHEAGLFATTADNSTFVGFQAGKGITGTKLTGNRNTAFGADAGLYLQGGASENCIFGALAGDAITTGGENCLFGMGAGGAIQTSIRNTFFGDDAGNTCTTGDSNVAIGHTAMGVGTTTGDYNIAIGHAAGKLISSGTMNTVVGGFAGDSLTTGTSNTAVGYLALSLEDAHGYNTAVGHSALPVLNAGADGNNVAVGYYSGFTTSTGTDNTFLGTGAGGFCTTGDNNTFVGKHAGLGITGTKLTGNDNTAVGENAGLLLQGAANSNTLIGAGAGDSITTGSGNTCAGLGGGAEINTGDNNIAIGNDSHDGGTTGDNNISIGTSSTPSSAGVENQITLGNSGTASLRCQIQTIAALSDQRDKTDIIDLPYGLDFINQTRPVQYKWDIRDEYINPKLGTNPHQGKVRNGFIAQELLALGDAEQHQLAFNDNPDRLEASYGSLIPMLTKAIQELSAQVEALTARITTLEG